MDKPLKDWTLGELKNYCDSFGGGCNGCRFHGKCTFADNSPCEWDLVEPPRFTEQEVEDAKALMRFFPGESEIQRASFSDHLILRSCSANDIELNSELFPSIKSYRTVKLSVIAGGK